MSSTPEAPTPRIFLRPIGSPIPMGMSGLAIASLVQGGLDLHWVAESQTPQIGLILIAVPFVLQALASVFCYLARDGAAGTAIGLLATSWLAMGLVQVVSAPGARSGALALMLLAAAAMLMLATLTISMAKPLPAVVFGAEALRFALAAIYEFGGASGWRNAAGLTGLAVVALAGYCVLAFALEDQQQQPVLPTFRRGRGQAAVVGTAEAITDAMRDPGVRHTT